jgi:hypothetical protein
MIFKKKMYKNYAEIIIVFQSFFLRRGMASITTPNLTNPNVWTKNVSKFINFDYRNTQKNFHAIKLEIKLIKHLK